MMTPSSGLHKNQSVSEASPKMPESSFKDFLNAEEKQRDIKSNSQQPPMENMAPPFRIISDKEAVSFQNLQPPKKPNNNFPPPHRPIDDKDIFSPQKAMKQMEYAKAIHSTASQLSQAIPQNAKLETPAHTEAIASSADRLITDPLPRPVVLPSRAKKPSSAYKQIQKGQKLPGAGRQS